MDDAMLERSADEIEAYDISGFEDTPEIYALRSYARQDRDLMQKQISQEELRKEFERFEQNVHFITEIEPRDRLIFSAVLTYVKRVRRYEMANGGLDPRPILISPGLIHRIIYGDSSFSGFTNKAQHNLWLDELNLAIKRLSECRYVVTYQERNGSYVRGTFIALSLESAVLIYHGKKYKGWHVDDRGMLVIDTALSCNTIPSHVIQKSISGSGGVGATVTLSAKLAHYIAQYAIQLVEAQPGAGTVRACLIYDDVIHAVRGDGQVTTKARRYTIGRIHEVIKSMPHVNIEKELLRRDRKEGLLIEIDRSITATESIDVSIPPT